ncbi:ribosomal protein L21-like protein [Xylariaceae sp. FL0255]|nr:ribosomal protein L21-like protein [Xylariaceae sp. FL0255]
MSRSLLRSVLGLRTPFTRLPPSFLLPIRALSTTPVPSAATTIETPTAQQPITSPKSTKQPPPTRSAPTTPSAPFTASQDASITTLLPILRAQPNHYITIHIHEKPYLVTPGDQIRLPFLMPGVLPGDVLRLDRASILGSRDYTLKGSPWIDGSLFECRATVLGVESEPLRVKVKTKRRNRRSQRVTSKHKYTILRISELKILGP